jgi:hypothetical protein
MWSVWIQVNPQTWVESKARFVEEQHAAQHAAALKGMLFDVRVFIQFGSDTVMQEVI